MIAKLPTIPIPMAIQFSMVLMVDEFGLVAQTLAG
jgi:hypothetical protein